MHGRQAATDKPPPTMLSFRRVFSAATSVQSRGFSASSALASSSSMEGNDSNFQQLLREAKVPLVVDFYANWCGPCKMLAPIVTRVVAESDGKARLIKVDVDDNVQLAGQYEIAALPTLALFKDGKLVDKIVGMRNESNLKQWLDKHTAEQK